MHLSTLLIAPLAAGYAAAICPGYNFGIGFQQNLGGGVSRWNVYDAGCNIVDGLTTNQNPCNSGTFGCTPAPITFNRYVNNFSKLVYSCRPDGRAGNCGGAGISVCCRNDGGKRAAPFEA